MPVGRQVNVVQLSASRIVESVPKLASGGSGGLSTVRGERHRIWPMSGLGHPHCRRPFRFPCRHRHCMRPEGQRAIPLTRPETRPADRHPREPACLAPTDLSDRRRCQDLRHHPRPAARPRPAPGNASDSGSRSVFSWEPRWCLGGRCLTQLPRISGRTKLEASPAPSRCLRRRLGNPPRNRPGCKAFPSRFGTMIHFGSVVSPDRTYLDYREAIPTIDSHHEAKVRFRGSRVSCR